MATNVLGSLILEFGANLARFESDMGRAQRIATKNARAMERSVNRELDKMSSSFNRVGSRFTSMAAGLAGGFSLAVGLRQLQQTVDAYDNVNARIKLITSSEKERAQVMQQVYEISKRTFTQLEDSANLLNRLTRALRSSGTEAEEALQKSLVLTETINQAFAVSGATTIEQQNAIIQLGQGLAAGTLRGQEFNAVSEQGVRIIQAMTDHLGVNIGQLREMAKQGKITASVVTNALLSQADKIQSEFNELPLTIGRSLSLLVTEFERYIGELNKAEGGSRKVANAIVLISQNLPLLINTLISGFKIWMAYVGIFKVLPALIAGATAMLIKHQQAMISANLAAEMGIKGHLSFAKVAKNALSVVFAAYAGWQLGTWIRENFQVARIAAAYFVESTLVGWERIKQGAQIAWEFIKTSFKALVQVLQTALADFIGQFASALELLPEKFGGQEMAESVREFELSLRPTTSAVDDFSAAVAEINQQAAVNVAKIKEVTGEMINYEYSNNQAAESTKALAGGLLGAGKAMEKKAKLTKEEREFLKDLRQMEKLYMEELKKQEQFDIERRQARVDLNAEFQETLAAYDDEILLLAQDERSRRRLQILLEAEEKIRQLIAAAKKLEMDPAFLRRMEQEILLKAKSLTLSEEQAEIAAGFNRAWEDSLDSTYDAFATFMSTGLSDWESFGNSLIRNSQSFLAQISRQFMSTSLNFGNQPQGLGGTTGAGQGIFGMPSQAQGANNLQSVGAWGNALGLAYGGWQNAANGGSRLSTVASFTEAGATFGPYGAIIGLFVGILVAVFKKMKPEDLRIGGAGSNVRDPEGSFETRFGTVRAGSRRLKWEQLIQPIQQFDEAIFDLVMSFDGGVARVEAIRDALDNWSVDLKGDEATAENVIESRFDAIVGTFDVAIQEFVYAAEGMEDRMQRLADALFAESIFEEAGLDVTFGEFLVILDDMVMAGESTQDAMKRIIGGVELLDKALDSMGLSLDYAGEDFVRFAADITAAAGSLERAEELWTNFFTRFYTPDELIPGAATRLGNNVANQLTGLGLDPNTSMAEFRRIFEERLPELSAEAIVTWLRAAEALSNLIMLEEQLEDLRRAQFQAQMEYRGFLAKLDETTEFQNDLMDIATGIQSMSAQADQLARNAGLAGASAEDLGRIVGWASRQFELAVSRLRTRITDLIAQLYGSPLERINSQIEMMEASSSAAADAMNEALDAQRQLYEDQLAYLESLQRYVDSLRLSELSPLNPSERFFEAQARFNELMLAAAGGDVNALSQLEGAAQQFLQEALSFLGPNDQYAELFNAVEAALQALIDAGPTVENPGDQTVTLVPSAELIALYAARDALLAEQEALQRAALAQSLATSLGELANALGQSVFSLADELEVSITQLITDLGIPLENLTAASVAQLALVAASLDTNLVSLANELGITLGQLNDTQSLLNDAFEAQLDGLPPEIEDVLRPLFEDVENATTEADANLAIEALRAVVLTLAPNIRNLLAPYLELDQTPYDQYNMLNESLGFIHEAILETNRLLSDMARTGPTPEVVPEAPTPPEPVTPVPPEPPDPGTGNGGNGGGPTPPNGGIPPAAVTAIINAVTNAVNKNARAMKDAAREMAVKDRGFR